MTLLVSVQNISKAFGSQTLFEEISFPLVQGDRMGLVGPNGAGKSTLLKILFGLESQDSGQVSKRQGVKIAYASQSPEFPAEAVKEVLMAASSKGREEALLEARILLDKAGFPSEELLASTLSGGWKKRLDILRAVIQEPDLILLDEPTNHLDLEGILWLEKFLRRERVSFLVVSHDRAFLESVCSKILELNRAFPKGTFLVDGGWSTFQERRFAFLEAQLKQERSLASSVREEVAWMRTSPKARTSKSKARLQKAEGMIEELGELEERNATRSVAIAFAASQRQTRSLITAKNLSKSFGDKCLFKGVDLKLSPGTRLGVVGENGTGKTTLLKILNGEEFPDMGTVKYADDLSLVYFDQHREQIDPNLTLKEALSPQGEFIRFQGQEIHVHGWAKRFLFFPDRLNLPVSCLSGGEKARILLARLMLKPADVLFLDEPTNDLDIATLEVMERTLLEFPGAVVLITHDRHLMDRVCTQILGLGRQTAELFADYSQWEDRSEKKVEDKKEEKKVAPAPLKKISYKEQKELEGMEAAIQAQEEKLLSCQDRIEKEGGGAPLYEEMAKIQLAIEALYERWQVLLSKKEP